jgi:8-oxo-dGTP pyrophosphatase MutT (NUDIX family)
MVVAGLVNMRERGGGALRAWLGSAGVTRTLDGVPTVVRAAGGVVVRAGDGVPEVVLVHRPKYDDWTLPKGKAEDGESDEDCALREVEEETGLVCELVEELEGSSYVDSAGRPKLVRYWLMRPIAGKLRPTHEVDDARWLSLSDAEEQLTYPRDVKVLRSARVQAYLPPA